jgi:hypothetical protein
MIVVLMQLGMLSDTIEWYGTMLMVPDITMDLY